MVGPVNNAGYQAYAPQQAVNAAVEVPRGGENRIEAREAPAGDSQRADFKSFASRDEAPQGKTANDDNRGKVVDIVV